MDVNELMCGDWVYNSVMKRNEKVVVVDSIFNKVTTSYEEGNSIIESELSYEDVEPIELTKEILKKNGFDIGQYAYYRIDENKYIQYYFYEHRFRVICEGIDEWENHSKVKDVMFQSHPYYVHELQQSMRLSKVNKEINKEIIL